MVVSLVSGGVPYAMGDGNLPESFVSSINQSVGIAKPFGNKKLWNQYSFSRCAFYIQILKIKKWPNTKIGLKKYINTKQLS